MTAQTWIEQYKTAWASNRPEDIRAMFTDDASYAGTPSDSSPWRGVDAIVEGWLRNADEPDTYTFEYEVLSDTGDLAFVQGLTTYLDERPTYDNLWVIRFADDGRATEFTEWYMARESKAS